MSLCAFSLSVTTPWVLDYISPPQTVTLEDIAVEKALSIKDKMITGLKGEEYKTAPIEKQKHWSDFWMLIVISIALAAILSSVIGYIRKENTRMVSVGICMGVASIVAIYSLMFMAVIILILFVGAILNGLGIDLSF